MPPHRCPRPLIYRSLPLLLTLGIFVLSACQSQTPVTAVEATAVVSQTESEPAATSSPTSLPPTPTTTPTLSPITTPLATMTTVASATATSIPALSTATPTATLIPGMIGPVDYPANVNPLTGLRVSDPTILLRRPIAIKISNLDRVRPQSGINKADLVFEHVTEGNITRFTAIYYTYDVEKVGSIRSGRLIDLELPIMYDAAFAYSGSAGPVRLMFRDSIFFDRIISPDFAHGGFERITDPEKPDQPVVDTLFTNTYNLRWILDQRGQNTSPNFQQGMAFHPDPPANGSPARTIEIAYTATYVFWQYNPATGRYVRWSDGLPHEDAEDGQQLNFKNIIVLGAHHQKTDIIENTGGGRSIEIQIWGEGPVSIFRDGQRFEGRWRRDEPDDMLTFYDLEGNILPLAPGNSFFQLVPLGFTDMLVTP